MHKGKIKCDSEEGEGSTFTITIPIKKEAFTVEEIDEKNKINIENVITTIVDFLPNAVPDAPSLQT